MNTAPRDPNDVPALLGTSNVDGTTVTIFADPVTHRLLVDSTGGSSTNFVDNEVVAGGGTAWTLAQTPVTGSQHIYANGQRLTPTVDYTITGAAITTVSSWTAGTLLADYRF